MKPFSSKTVWAGIWIGGIIESFFFNGSVTAHSYLDMLEKDIILALANEMDLEQIIYMYDRAPAHSAQAIRHFLDKTFPDRWMDWPPRSPDLTPTDFFMECDEKACIRDKTSKSSSTDRCFFH